MTNHPLMVVLGHLSKFGGGIAAGRMEWAVESEVEAACSVAGLGMEVAGSVAVLRAEAAGSVAVLRA